MKINYKLLKKFGACQSGIGKFVNTFGTFEIPKNVSEIIIKGDDNSDASWFIDKLKPKNCIVKFEKSNGYWETNTYDDNNNLIKFENSDGYWYTKTYNDNNNLIKVEKSDGVPKYDFTVEFK